MWHHQTSALVILLLNSHLNKSEQPEKSVFLWHSPEVVWCTVSPRKPSLAPALWWLHGFWCCHESTSGMKRGCETFLLAASLLCQLGLLPKHHLRDWSQHLFFTNSTFCKVMQTRKDFERGCNKQVRFSKPQNKLKFASFSSCSKPRFKEILFHPSSLLLMWGDMSYGKAHAAF